MPPEMLRTRACGTLISGTNTPANSGLRSMCSGLKVSSCWQSCRTHRGARPPCFRFSIERRRSAQPRMLPSTPRGPATSPNSVKSTWSWATPRQGSGPPRSGSQWRLGADDPLPVAQRGSLLRARLPRAPCDSRDRRNRANRSARHQGHADGRGQGKARGRPAVGLLPSGAEALRANTVASAGMTLIQPLPLFNLFLYL